MRASDDRTASACVNRAGKTVPPHALCVFSIAIKRVRGSWMSSSSRMASRTASRSMLPSGRFGTVLVETPPNCDAPACSNKKMWLLSPTMISDPLESHQASTHARLHIVPDGKNNAASLRNMAAIRVCSSSIVGSSPMTSSPTIASAMRWRIAAVGLVTVSLLKSILHIHIQGCQ